MQGYSITHQAAVGTDLGIVNLTGDAAFRIYLYEFWLGFSSAPADSAIIFELNRSTDIGVGGTPLVEEERDPLNPNAASAAAVGGTFGTEPLDGNALWRSAMNQNGGPLRWAARPGFELITKTTVGNGLFLRSVASSTGTPNVDVTMSWFE